MSRVWQPDRGWTYMIAVIFLSDVDFFKYFRTNGVFGIFTKENSFLFLGSLSKFFYLDFEDYLDFFVPILNFLTQPQRNLEMHFPANFNLKS